MKKIVFSFTALAFIITTAFTGSSVCDTNDYFHQSVKSMMGYYNGAREQTGTGTSEVTKVYTSGDSTIAIISSTYKDTKKDEPNSSEMKLVCVNGAFVMDMGEMMNSRMPAGQDIKMVCTGNFVTYKSSYTVGEKLEDVNMTVETYSGGNLLATTNVKITDRKVESYADLVVPAGTFKCYKISYTTSSEMKMQDIAVPAMQPSRSVAYFCPTAGMVRMEQYKQDKIDSYNELLSLTKP